MYLCLDISAKTDYIDISYYFNSTYIKISVANSFYIKVFYMKVGSVEGNKVGATYISNMKTKNVYTKFVTFTNIIAL